MPLFKKPSERKAPEPVAKELEVDDFDLLDLNDEDLDLLEDEELEKEEIPTSVADAVLRRMRSR